MDEIKIGCVPVTDGAARAGEHHVWGGSLWLWHQWRHRWRILAGKPPRLSLWLLRSSQDSLPHPEWQDHTQAHNPRSPNIFTMCDFIHKQLPLFCSARRMSHGNDSSESVIVSLNISNSLCSMMHSCRLLRIVHWKLDLLCAHWHSDFRMQVLLSSQCCHLENSVLKTDLKQRTKHF